MLAMIGSGVFGTYTSGYTRRSEYGNVLFSLVFALIIDIFVIDTLIVMYAYYDKNSAYLTFLAFRGFYIEPEISKYK